MSTNDLVMKVEKLKELEKLLEEVKTEAESVRDEIKQEMLTQDTEELEAGQYIIRLCNIVLVGVTFLDGTGAYRRRPTEVIVCAFSRSYIIPVKKLVQQIDPAAFIIVCDTHEILGEGFGSYDPKGL